MNKEKVDKEKVDIAVPKKVKKEEEKPRNIKLTYKEKLEMERLTKDLEMLEKQKSKIEEQLSSGNLDGGSINELSVELGELVEKIDLITLSWMELADKEGE